MRTSVKRFLALAIASTAIGCETSENSLSLTEKAALSEALTTSGALDGANAAAGFGVVAVYMLPNVGTLSAGTMSAVNSALNASVSGIRAASYEGAVGVQVIYDATAAGEDVTFTGVIGWDGLNVAASTVDEVVVAGAVTTTTTPAGNGAHSIAFTATDGFASYWKRAGNEDYLGNSGTFTLTNSTFGGSQVDCASLSETASCNYRTGTMNGSFEFGATRTGATGSYTQTLINFASLPAVKITIVE